MQSLAERWPEIVREAAGAFAHVQNFTVLDGAAGVNRALIEVASSGMAGFQFVRGLFVPKTPASDVSADAGVAGTYRADLPSELAPRSDAVGADRELDG